MSYNACISWFLSDKVNITGFDYPLKDLAALKKLYKEVRGLELK